MASVDEIEAMLARDIGAASMTPAPAAPAPAQLQSLVDQPTRAPTDVELGVAQLRGMSPLEQALADISGRKLLAQESATFGISPKVEAGMTAAKGLLFGENPLEQFQTATTNQDILKEYVRQKDLEEGSLLFGLTGPEVGGALLSPINKLQIAKQVAVGTPLLEALAIRSANVGKTALLGASGAGLESLLSRPGTIEERMTRALPAAGIGLALGAGLGTVGEGIGQAANLARENLGVVTQRSAKAVAAKGLEQMGLDEATLAQAMVEKAALQTRDPRFAKLSTTDLVPIPEAAASEKLLAGKSTANANRELLTTDAAETIGKAGQDILASTRDQARKDAGALFTKGVRAIEVPVAKIGDEAKTLYNKYYGNNLTPSNALQDVYDTFVGLGKPPKQPKKPIGFGRQAPQVKAPTDTTVGVLQDLRSEALELGRKAQKGSPDKSFANDLAKAIGDKIDAVPGTSGLRQARDQWRSVQEVFYRGPLKNLDKLAPEKLVSTLANNSLKRDAWFNVFGSDNAISKAVAKQMSVPKRGLDIGNTGVDLASVEKVLAPKQQQGIVQQLIESLPIAGSLSRQARKLLGERSETLIGKELVQAFKDPAAAYQLLQQAKAINAGPTTSGLLSALTPGLASLTTQPDITPIPGLEITTQQEPVAVEQQKQPSAAITDEQRQQLLDLKRQLEGGTAQASPQPKAVKVGKQNVSIPTGEKYAPPSLVKAVIQVESAGKPEAVSSKGAGGLMQLMPATAKQLGIEDRFDPEQNVEGGSRYLQQMLDKYGKTDIALAAYNWGPGNIDKAIRQVKADGKRVTWANIMQAVKVPQETRLYVNKVLSREQEA